MGDTSRTRSVRRKRASIPETFCSRSLSELCLRRDIEGLRRYLLRFEGSCVSLGWPAQCVYIVGGMYSPYSITDIDLEHCQNDFFGEPRSLQPLGSVSHFSNKYPVFLDPSGAVIVYDAREDCLYEVASDLNDFFVKGMIRCDPVHESICRRIQPDVVPVPPAEKAEMYERSRHSTRLRYLRSWGCFRGLLACPDNEARSRYVEEHRNAKLALIWPEDHCVTLCNAQDVDLSPITLRRYQRFSHGREPVLLLGVIEGEGTKTFFRNVKVFCGDSGAVYVVLVGQERLTHIARDLKTFVRIGLCPLIDDFRYENIGPVDCHALNDIYPETRLPFKKRRIVLGHFEPLNALYLRGQPRFTALWRGLRDAWISTRGRPRERPGGLHLQRFVRANAGRWLAFNWPPLHGLLVGDLNYFGLTRDRKTYQRFSCFREASRLFFLGMVSVYECLPQASQSPEVWVSNQGHVFTYVPTEDRVYVLAVSFNELFESGLFAVSSYFERPYVDEIVENAWYQHNFADMNELSQLLHDRKAVVRFCQLHAGTKVRLGGRPSCTFTFGSWNVAEADEANRFVIGILEKAKYAVIGWLEPVNRAVFMDTNGCVHVLIYGTVMLKLAETLRGFIRQGSFWFRCSRRFCFSPLGSVVKPVSSQKTQLCDVSEYVYSSRNLLQDELTTVTS
ncbi:protein UL29 [Cercopithecine betaherpesvirus 5]|uniref:Protein UL29 n=1 Tax=Simian cytomegalovirus (strain Colburn) TaxID=50292 RepID=G8XTA1_SCMVC|nr:protein UL29 [Cercopithecine betaherpesvirus 5]AEV80394.1 protein UL29 [Cercopithecine betaherpesvirus 5]